MRCTVNAPLTTLLSLRDLERVGDNVFRSEPTPDDPTLHRCMISYATDISLNDNALRHHGHKGPHGPLSTSSLDHSVWFHVDARADEWLLLAMESPRAKDGRGYSRGQIFRRDGVHVASAVQESIPRPVGR